MSTKAGAADASRANDAPKEKKRDRGGLSWGNLLGRVHKLPKQKHSGHPTGIN